MTDIALLAERAPAKINLSLHVAGRRMDGFHELASLVAFTATGDVLTLAPADRATLRVTGPRAAAAGHDADNLVLKAHAELAARVDGLRAGAFHLVKNLPAAAGIGGGSSDAAAALRLLARANAMAADDPRIMEAAAAAGSDVPVCVGTTARMMYGRGERLGPPIRLPPLFAVLANPGVAVATPGVFRALGLEHGEAARAQAHVAVPPAPSRRQLLDLLQETANDLQAPACRIAPQIETLLQAMKAMPGCRLARMSGSGATCFALFDDAHAARRSARDMRRTFPAYWIKGCVLR